MLVLGLAAVLLLIIALYAWFVVRRYRGHLRELHELMDSLRAL